MNKSHPICAYCQRVPQSLQILNRTVICYNCIAQETAVLRPEDLEPPKKDAFELARELEKARQTPKGESVPGAVLDILQQCRVEQNVIFIPKHLGILPRKLYEAVDTALLRIGGSWNKKAQGHVFLGGENPRVLLDQMLETREMPPRNSLGYFPTPDELAWQLAAKIPASARTILEPSAGTGNLARILRDYCHQRGIAATLHCCEIQPRFQVQLQAQGFMLVASDFLTYRPGRIYDAIVMNPPFTLDWDSHAYVTHINHAWWELLAPGGLLISIAPAGFANRVEKPIKQLRDLVEELGHWEELPAGSFQSSGTGVNTVLLELRKS